MKDLNFPSLLLFLALVSGPATYSQAPLFRIDPDATCPSIGFQPSQVSPGAESYKWDLGDGRSSSAATPERWYYSEAGAYTVSLRMLTKRGQKLMDTVEVLDASGWGEFPFLDEHPDFYVQVSELNGSLLYTSPYVENKRPPVAVPTFFLLDEQLYQMRVMDWDQIGNDDLMGTVILNGQLSGQEAMDGKLRVKWRTRPADELYQHKDTVLVIVPKVIISGDSLWADAGGLEREAGVAFQWYFNDQAIAGGNTPALKPVLSGDYSVKVILNGRCNDLSAPAQWPGLVADREPATQVLGRLYPNPAIPHAKVRCLFICPANAKATVKITDLLGRQVAQYRFRVQSGENLLEFSAPEQRGYWLVSVHTPQLTTPAFKLITH